MRTNLRPSARAMRLADGGLAHAGRADEAEDRALHLPGQLAHRQELEDALLHLVEAVVVLVEDLLAASAMSSSSSVCFDQGRATSQSR